MGNNLRLATGSPVGGEGRVRVGGEGEEQRRGGRSGDGEGGGVNEGEGGMGVWAHYNFIIYL